MWVQLSSKGSTGWVETSSILGQEVVRWCCALGSVYGMVSASCAVGVDSVGGGWFGFVSFLQEVGNGLGCSSEMGC